MIRSRYCLGIVILALIVVPVAAFSAMSEELNLFTIENRTGADIKYIFVSTGNSEDFGADILGVAGPLRNRQEIALFVHYPNRCGLFNILAAAVNAEYFSVFHYEICDGKQARLQLGRNYFAGTKQFDPNTDVVIENGTSHRILHLFFASGGSNVWGIDFLSGKGGLPPGETARLRLVTPVEKHTYAVRAIDERGQTYSFAIDVDGNMREYIYEIGDDWVDAQSD